jgi:hypothetical protein
MACAGVVNAERRRMLDSSPRKRNDERWPLVVNIVLCCEEFACVLDVSKR